MKERKLYASITILLDGSIVIWSKKPDICHNRGLVQFIERKRRPIAILPEGSAVMWSKKYVVTPVSLNYKLVYILT